MAATQQQAYKPGDWVIYQGTKDRYRGWHFEVTSVEHGLLRLVEEASGVRLRCRVGSVRPEFD